MLKRERVWTALTGRVTDRPPLGEILLEEAWLQAAGFPGLAAALEQLQADLAVLPLTPRTGRPATNWQEWRQSEIFLFGSFQGPVTFFSERLGWHAFSRLIIKQPVETRTLLQQYLSAAAEQAIAALQAGCDGIVVFDDLAGDKGLLINPKFFSDSYFPLLQQVLGRLDCAHVPVVFHSDGNIVSLVPALREAGFWGIQGLQPLLGITPALFQDQKDWIYWGNFDFEGQGRLKTAAEAEQDVVRLLDAWQDFPGFLFGSSGGLYKGLPWPAIGAAYKAAANWRRQTNATT